MGNTNRILIENTNAIRVDPGRLNAAGGEGPIIECRIAATRFRPISKVRKLDKQDCRLEGIEPEIAADKFVVVFRLRSMGTHGHEAFMQGGIVGHNHSAITGAAEVLARKETEAANGSNASRFAALVSGRNGLRRVLDHIEVMLCGDFHDRVHVAHLPV